MQMQWIAGLFFAIVIAVFALQNTAPVTVRFLTFALEGVALALVILVSAALAAGATMLLGLARNVRHSTEVKELRHEIADRETQIAHLHAQPQAAPLTITESVRQDVPPGS